VAPSRPKALVLIGAGSAVFTREILTDIVRSGRPMSVRLVDIDPDALETVDRLARRMVAATGAPVEVRADVDRRAVLPGADAVVTTIAVGGRRAWEQDVLVPRRFGIFQPVGDSVMPGGVSRALRQIPAMLAIAEDVKRLAPAAVFFNYANPLAPMVQATRQATGAAVYGLCHGVRDTERYLLRRLARDDEAAVSGRIRHWLGVNHLTWLYDLEYAGHVGWEPVWAMLAERPPEDNPFSWELFRLYEALPSALDRHVIEFWPALCRPGAYWGKTPGVDAYSFEGTIAAGDAAYDTVRTLAHRPDPVGADMLFGPRQAKGEGEQLYAILSALWDDRPLIVSVNAPNAGRLPGLSDDDVIEGPALVDGRGIHPLWVNPPSEAVQAIIAHRVRIQRLMVDAALRPSLKTLVQAVMADGTVSRPSEAEALARALVEAQQAYLPPAWKDVMASRDAAPRP
jgi:alpha-galactosidase